jgi:hypothetical protein
MKASLNKYLIVNKGVILTPIIEPVIYKLDLFFHKANLKARVTSGLRDAHGQLAVIKRYLLANGLDKEYPDAILLTGPTEKIANQYVWQMAWSHLLSIGVIINPPLAAKVLMDYKDPRTGKNRIGDLINQTPHARGTCFDIGGAGGDDSSIKDELEVVKEAFGKIPGFVNYLPEHANNAIHCDCKLV